MHPPVKPYRKLDARAVREATKGAVEALAVMTSFVIFGLGWAFLARAGPPATAGTQFQAQIDRLAPASATRYCEVARSPSLEDAPETRHASSERRHSRQTRRSSARALERGCAQ